jgi:tripartite-type tricarboxylate transporter receptor subunit TctC
MTSRGIHSGRRHMQAIPRFLAAALVALSAPAALAQAYPSTTIRIIVPFTPGTGADTIARAMQPELSKRLGQPVVVENKPGASGTIGEDQVAKANPDGYTLLMAGDSMAIAPQLYRNVPFHPVRDFQPVSLAARGTLVLVANPKTGIQSVRDLLQRAKARPGQITYGSPGVGTPHHMAMELLKNRASVFMLHVPYKGSSGYVQDLLAGELNVGFLPFHVAQSFIRQGKLVPLAVAGAKRHPAAPEVATLAEQGLKDTETEMWFGYFVPLKTPEPVVRKIRDAVLAVLETPEVKNVLSKAGLEADASSPAELHDIIQKDYARWGAVIRKNNITAD